MCDLLYSTIALKIQLHHHHQSETKTNQLLATPVSPRFRQFVCFLFELPLAPFHILHCFEWPLRVFRFCFFLLIFWFLFLFLFICFMKQPFEHGNDKT